MPTPDTGPFVVVQEVSKHFFSGTSFSDLLRLRFRGSRVDALRGVTLEIASGRALGVMGKNGAGKSTLLRLVAGLLDPDQGAVSVNGLSARQGGSRYRRQVCFVNSDERSFSWRLSGRQNLEFFVALHGFSGKAAQDRVEQALQASGLGRDARRPVREYSSGMRQRLALARGLLGEADLLVLDEPMKGVDPEGAAGLRSLIQGEMAQGRTVLLASHDLADIKHLCQRVAVLEQGRVVHSCDSTEIGHWFKERGC